MWGGEFGRLALLVGLLVGSCNCSKADDDSTKKTPSITTPAPAVPTPPAVDTEPLPSIEDDVRDFTDEDDEDAEVLDISHGTSDSVAHIPGNCEPTIHTELERRMDCPGWTILLGWVAAPTRPGDLAATVTAARPESKRRVISKTPIKTGVLLLTDRPDGSRAFEGWFHRGDKLVYLETRAPRARFKALSAKLKAVATDFVTRNVARRPTRNKR